SFTIGSNSYAAAGVPDLDQPSQTLYADLGDTAYPAVIASAAFGGGSSLSFNMYGAPSAAGTVVVQAGDYVRTVEVASTGAISVLP
ncbi:MAG: hypothetical protein KDA41_17945, partial [Planctomycetales bacterium]|nr:hypothetical protein [Planctomycetales bacterium]